MARTSLKRLDIGTSLLAGAIAVGTVALPANAATVSITIPKIHSAEYHRPYVAGWIEPATGGAPRTVFVWYDIKNVGKESGTKWLSELRTWWRKGGRSLKMPANGISGATRAPGTHQVTLPAMPAGQYVLHIEAAREAGGRELVSIPFTVPAKASSKSGSRELGSIAIR